MVQIENIYASLTMPAAMSLFAVIRSLRKRTQKLYTNRFQEHEFKLYLKVTNKLQEKTQKIINQIHVILNTISFVICRVVLQFQRCRLLENFQLKQG